MFLPIFLFLIIIVSIPGAHAHPVALKAGIGDGDQYLVIDLVKKTPKSDDGPMFLSVEWFEKYPIGILVVVIIVIVGSYSVFLYREEIGKILPFKNHISNLTIHHEKENQQIPSSGLIN